MPAWAGTQRKRIWNMRGCFDHYTGGTYDHIRMDCLFIIYGLFASVWPDEVAGEAMGAVAPDQGRNGSCVTTESSREPAPSDGISTKNNVWYRIEEVLRYGGLRRRMPHFTAEKWVAGNVLLIAAVFGGTQVLGCKMITSLLYLMITMAVEMILLNTFRFLEYRSVNDNILKCLNFLGNYSLTAGEITGVLGQVSKYMEEPLKGVMEECAYEAQMTGNSSTALLAMAEKVEHPKFKELARNLEISIRYMADLTTLVDSSRRSVREYLRTEEERKGMLREAAINMGLLAAMSVFALMTVDRLIDVSVWKIVTDTLPGHLALGIYGIIFGLFLRKVYGFRR